MEFEWDEAKRAANIRKHGVDFVDAARVLIGNPYTTESHNAGNDEKRLLAIGEQGDQIITVIYTMRGKNFRIISARKARDDEKEKFWHLHSE